MKTTTQFALSFIIGSLIFLGGNSIYKSYTQKTIDLEYKNELAYDKSGNIYSGEYKRYLNNTSLLEASGNYINGKKEGEFLDFHSNKKINIKSNYINGKLDGEFTIYNKEGTITEQSTYLNGNKEGKSEYFYSNGQLSGFTNSIEGKLNGETKGYFENGEIKYELSYKNDQKDGNEYYYNTKGDKIQDFDYKEGELIKGTLWNDNGIKTLDLFWEEGKTEITKIEYDKKGNIIE